MPHHHARDEEPGAWDDSDPCDLDDLGDGGYLDDLDECLECGVEGDLGDDAGECLDGAVEERCLDASHCAVEMYSDGNCCCCCGMVLFVVAVAVVSFVATRSKFLPRSLAPERHCSVPP